ncbi:MAG TPA: lytic transglycosylase domain-containing protein [Streptosporangiaceae bacterium]|nr:lytic transglycosylase domain-containing protein [Streptosporangiaceae bacterium]
MARHFPLPSFLSTKRSRMISFATAGTLTVATAISLAATLPAGSSPVPASADAAYTTTIGQQAAAQSATDGVGQAVMFSRMRSIQGERQQQQLAAEKAAAAKAAARKAAAAKAAALKSAQQTAAARKAAAKPAQRAQPAQQAAVTTPSGSPEQIAEQMLSQFGWSSSQFSCLQPLWEHESGWSVTAENPTSGAYGIPQSLPASQMSSAGADWQTNAATQIRWGLTYIQGRYGSPCGAWSHEESGNWY